MQGARTASLKQSLCFNCLKPNHLSGVCRSGHCKKCTVKHHTLLHPAEGQTHDTSDRNTDNSGSSCLHTRISSEVLLSTAIIHIQNAQGNYVKIKCILDSGAQSNFLTERACEKLSIAKKRIENPITVTGFNINITPQGIGERYNQFERREIYNKAKLSTNLGDNGRSSI